MNAEGYVFSDGRASGIPEDLVAEVAGVLRYYACDLGPLGDDAVARAILAARAWNERHEAEKRAHARRHEGAARETRTLLDLAEARRRARACIERGRCADHYTAGGTER